MKHLDKFHAETLEVNQQIELKGGKFDGGTCGRKGCATTAGNGDSEVTYYNDDGTIDIFTYPILTAK